MEVRRKIFLVDANTFITPYRGYYPFDLAPKFWRNLEEKIIDGSIAILDKVYDELSAGGDDLSDWLSKISSYSQIVHKNPDIITIYSDILTHIQTSGLYTSKALTEWSDIRIADPWLVACAKINEFTVVTFEASNANLNNQSPSSHPKIPDICKEFGVEHTNLFNMMRALSINVS
ncbi:MAG: DUF4411 family protein [Oscillospiraceae bacterium]|nr:DUF4411 family protein [Oscillospiraceae bacterium]